MPASAGLFFCREILRTMSIFDKRLSFKPFEYPEVIKYKDAINYSYWLVGEWNFMSDVHDFYTNISDIERSAIKKSMLAISQIEVAVKKFWVKIGDYFPKAEFDQVGITFGDCEVRHADAYSHLLEILGLDYEFSNILQNQVIQSRVNYLEKFLQKPNDNRGFISTLALFSLFVENVSLFSQFLVIKSLNKHTNLLKDMDNVIQATQKEELIHAMFGGYLINQVKQEFPNWFDSGFYDNLYKASYESCGVECRIIDWIFEDGELEFLDKSTVKEFIKTRFNDSLAMIGGESMFLIDEEKIKNIQWFMDEMYAEVNTDFFHKKPVTYSKNTQSITAGDLF
jgi:ribonucleoside-diphosphate reductase beta chain